MSAKYKSIIHLIDIGEQFSEANEDNPMSEIEVLTEGYWEHEAYGEVVITEEDIDKFIENFNSKTRRIDIAVDMDHQPEKGALGWFKELKKVVKDGVTRLNAVIEWTSLGVEMIEKGIYRYFSPEFYFEYEDPETHEIYENVLMGGGLTNRPYFKSLAPVQLSENMFSSIKLQEKKVGEEKMTREELLAELEENEGYELPEDASDEDKALLEELKSEEESEEDEELDEEAGEEEAEPVESEDEEEDEEAVEATEKVNAKEFNAVKSELGVLKKKLQFKEAEEKIEGYTFSESNQDGRLLPKSKKVAHKLLMSLSNRQRKMFDEFVTSLPKVDAVMFDEMGGEGDSVKASEELGKKVSEFMEKHEGMTYGQALKKVSADNPELVEKARLGK